MTNFLVELDYDHFIWPKMAEKSNMENLGDLSMLLIFN